MFWLCSLSNLLSEIPEPPPKTYTTKDKFEYFKPHIQVEMDNHDKEDTVTEMYIRGWKIDEPIMTIFKQCIPKMDRLTTIKYVIILANALLVLIERMYLYLCVLLFQSLEYWSRWGNGWRACIYFTRDIKYQVREIYESHHYNIMGAYVIVNIIFTGHWSWIIILWKKRIGICWSRRTPRK